MDPYRELLSTKKRSFSSRKSTSFTFYFIYTMDFSGMFFCIIGPSGVGKGTILSKIKEDWENKKEVLFPITATTRDPREGEVSGKDYYFLKKEEFEKKLKNEEFLEHAIVHGKNYYGLPKDKVFSALENGGIVLRELDIQGLWNLQKIIPKENLFSIFIMPPSMAILEKRIRGRSTLPEEEITRRLTTAKKEIEHSKECDAVIVSKEGQVNSSVIEVKNRILREIALNQKEK